jgi:hypothetical protein
MLYSWRLWSDTVEIGVALLPCHVTHEMSCTALLPVWNYSLFDVSEESMYRYVSALGVNYSSLLNSGNSTLTDCMERRPAWEASSRSAGQKLNVFHRAHKMCISNF